MKFLLFLMHNVEAYEFTTKDPKYHQWKIYKLKYLRLLVIVQESMTTYETIQNIS